MNNTQQAGETAFVEKHMKVIREKMKESMIEQQITRNREYLRASMQHFLDGGNVSGQFYLSLMEMMSPAILSPTPAPDAVEAKVAEKARLYVEDFCKPIYYHSENCHKAALLSYLAGHAEGLKATVEAKSAGVWVKASERLGDFKSTERKDFYFFYPGFCKIDGRPAYQPIFRKDVVSGDLVFIYSHGDGYCESIDKAEFHRLEWLDETPTSHAEGENGAVGFAEWAVINCTELPASKEIDNPPIWTYERKDYTTLELYNLYLTC